MKKVCAWCSEYLGNDDSHRSDESVSHGICSKCAREVFKEMSESMRDFLDRFDEPILLIGPDPKILTANKSAQNLLQKDLSQIEGYQGGEVLECVHAHSEEGCGSNVHCQSCTIRNTVLETFKTGKCFERVPCYLDIHRADETKETCIRISTEKAGKLVLLRVDDVRETPLDHHTKVA